MKRTNIAGLLCACVLNSAFAAAQDNAARSDVIKIPARELRGFGKLSGKFTRLENGASHLEIACESEERARIVHAKYINDLQLFQEPQAKTISVGTSQIPVAVVPQGAVTAFREKKIVHIVIGKTEAALTAALGSLRGVLRDAELAPSGTLPMYLGAFENSGFRFPGEERHSLPEFECLEEAFDLRVELL
ncbi:MAG TPA: hypothetical protein VGP72_02375 [Planctomycetota bacterium]